MKAVADSLAADYPAYKDYVQTRLKHQEQVMESALNKVNIKLDIVENHLVAADNRFLVLEVKAPSLSSVMEPLMANVHEMKVKLGYDDDNEGPNPQHFNMASPSSQPVPQAPGLRQAFPGCGPPQADQTAQPTGGVATLCMTQAPRMP